MASVGLVGNLAEREHPTMISRVAETCFWLHRQAERAEAIARLLRVNRGFVLDAPLPEDRKWFPLLVVAGEHQRFAELHPGHSADADLVQEYLVWERDNPVSIMSATFWARENARTIREVISPEMWEVLNELWRWLNDGGGRREYGRDPEAFYRRVANGLATLHGVTHTTMLHATPYDFMQLGTVLERAGQTARVLDVHHHTFGGGNDALLTPLARVQWLALLNSCSGTGPFLRRVRSGPTGPAVTRFLMHDTAFPRSVAHCLAAAAALMARLRLDEDHGVHSWGALAALRASLAEHRQSAPRGAALHQALTEVINGTAEVCAAVHRDYFDPAPVASGASQTQSSSAE